MVVSATDQGTSIVSGARASDLAANNPPKPEPTITTRWRAVLVEVMIVTLALSG
jgi:hypothetical protein